MLNLHKIRQEIYDRIRLKSRDEVILEDMVRHGFWPKEGAVPDDPADEIRKKGELRKELQDLGDELKGLRNLEKLKKEARKKRLKESKEKRQETKRRKESERKVKAEAWRERKKSELLYLGEEVSGGILDKESDFALLEKNNLPQLHSVNDLAEIMGVTVSSLRFLAFNRKVSKINHYANFAIPKKNGDLRHISAPKPRLKQTQNWILENILEKVELHEASKGFRKNKSIIENAFGHLNSEVVVNIDLKDFFPTITYKRVKGLFRSLGYSEGISTVLGLLCTEADVEKIDNFGEVFFVANGDRKLPQGAPSSPAITNVICRKMDRRLTSIAQKQGFVYSRYADDLSFSSKTSDNKMIGRLIRQVDNAVKWEGFNLNPAKTKVLRKGRRQEVTGIVVNEKLSVNKKKLKAFRALLYQIENDGPDGKFWGNSNDVILSAIGYANFIFMVDAERGRKFKEQVKRISEKYNYSPPPYVKPETEAQKKRRIEDESSGKSQKTSSSFLGKIKNFLKGFFASS